MCKDTKLKRKKESQYTIRILEKTTERIGAQDKTICGLKQSGQKRNKKKQKNVHCVN